MMDDKKLNGALASVLSDVGADASRYETHEERADIAEYQVMVLVAGYKRALAALKAAPDPTPPVPVVLGYCYCVQGEYGVWYSGERTTALGEVEL